MVQLALKLALNDECTRRKFFEQVYNRPTLEKALQRCRATEDATT